MVTKFNRIRKAKEDEIVDCNLYSYMTFEKPYTRTIFILYFIIASNISIQKLNSVYRKIERLEF